jgi:folate-binding Fe-S cluster repair protein YgfZ
MYYLGKLKRRMYLAHIEQEKLPVAGEPLYASHSDSGQGAGQVVMASPAAKGGVDLLMVCPVNLVEAGPITLGSPNGAELQLLPLPYDVPLERKAN